MNQERRDRLRDVTNMIDDVISEISDIRDEEQEAFDNMPEGLQCATRGESMQHAIDLMDDLMYQTEELRGVIEDAVDELSPKRKKK